MNDYKVGIYIRLSKEDFDKEKNNESESIKNQRDLIYSFLKNNNLSVYNEYIDDGYSGTSFNRPGFNELIKDIEDNKINMVITKDLSRLGRDYIKTGYYVEEYFPLKKVRYVSILDGVDTSKNITTNDIAPFKALFNDMVSKDTSRKIKSILKNKKEQGLFLGNKAPYGYKKDKLNKNKLIINKRESEVVKKIFRLALEGNSHLSIAKMLNSSGIISPKKGVWTASSIYNILNNKEYTGCLISNVWTNISYKNKKRIKRDKSEWIIVKNTHPKIIDEEVFELLKTKKIKKQKKSNLLLDGLIYCFSCGSKMGTSYLKKRDYYVLNCNRYKKDSKSCSSHYIKYEDVEEYIKNKTKDLSTVYKILIGTNKEIIIIYK